MSRGLGYPTVPTVINISGDSDSYDSELVYEDEDMF
jgi:hypothetical protein